MRAAKKGRDVERLPSRFEAWFYFVVRQAPSIHHVCVSLEILLVKCNYCQEICQSLGSKVVFFANSGVQIK